MEKRHYRHYSGCFTNEAAKEGPIAHSRSDRRYYESNEE